MPLNGAAGATAVAIDVTLPRPPRNGICYPVMTRHIKVDLGAGTASVGAPSEEQPAAAPSDVAPTPPPPGLAPGGDAPVGFIAAIGLAPCSAAWC